MRRIAQSYNHKPQSNLAALVRYIIQRNENAVIDWVEQNGVQAGNSPKELAEDAMLVLGKAKRKGTFENTLKGLYEIHPDKKLILEFSKPCTCQSKENNFEGEEAKQNFFKTPLFRLLAVVLGVLLLIFLISKSD